MSERSREIQTFRIELGEKTEFSDFKKNRINQAIKSIVIGRSSSSSVAIHARTKEGDEFYLYPGRVVNFKNPIQGIVFSWPAYTNEWAEIDISESEHFVSFTPMQETSLVSNIASKRVTKLVDVPFWGYGSSQTKLVDQNPNRLSLELEVLGFHRVYIGDFNDTQDSVGVAVRVAKCETIMPFCKKVISSNEELWTIMDENYISAFNQGIGSAGLKVRVTEYLK